MTKKKCSCEPFEVCKICAQPEVSENDVEKLIIKYCDNLPRCKVTKTSTTGRRTGNKWIKAKKSERKGKADLTICYFGFYIETEVKKPGKGIQSDDQKAQEKETNLAMGQYWLVDSLGGFIEHMDYFYKQIIINLKKV